MAIKTKTVAICDICGYMVEANCDNVGCAEAPDNWSHGKNGGIDICPRCAKTLERPKWTPREKDFKYGKKGLERPKWTPRETLEKGCNYAEERSKAVEYSRVKHPL